jgi:hypothetical protein
VLGSELAAQEAAARAELQARDKALLERERAAAAAAAARSREADAREAELEQRAAVWAPPASPPPSPVLTGHVSSLLPY